MGDSEFSKLPVIKELEKAKSKANGKPRRISGQSPRSKLYGVTAKQEQFIQNVLSGMTYSDAYRASYDVRKGTKPNSIHVAASQLLVNPAVKKRMLELEAEQEEQRKFQGQTMAVRVIERLEREANDRTNPASVRVRALELLGKTVGAFTEVRENKSNANKSTAELEQDLVELIRLAKEREARAAQENPRKLN